MWTDQSFVAARRSGLGLSFREWVGGSNPQPALKGDSVGKCLGGAWDGGIQGRSPPPPGDGGFLEAPSVARRLAVGSFVFRSPGEAPEKEGTRAGGHWDWWQLVEKSN